jgi:hypothetical protein
MFLILYSGVVLGIQKLCESVFVLEGGIDSVADKFVKALRSRWQQFEHLRSEF